MTLQETAKILSIIAATFDRFEVDEFKAKVWHAIIGHHEYKQTEIALLNWLSKPRDFPPQPGTINDEIRLINEPTELKITWGEAWHLIEISISRFGQYDVLSAVKFLPERAVRALGGEHGFKELCLLPTDLKPTFRAQFRQRYEELKEKNKAEALALPELNNLQLTTHKNVMALASSITKVIA